MGDCAHLDQVQDVQPHTRGCEECLKTGDRWVHLRLCLTCGHVGCAIRPKISTQPSTFIGLSIRSCDRLSPAKIGDGASLTGWP